MLQAQADVDKYQGRLKLAVDAEKVYQPLLDKGYVSKLQVMQATDARTEMSRLVANAEAQVTQWRESAAALKAQRDSYIQQYFTATSKQLVLDRNDRDVTQDGLDKAKRLRDLTSLDAPENAVVLKIGRISSGSVASGGGSQAQAQDPLFTLVPIAAPVEADVNVRSEDIGFVKVGDPVQLKLEAYRFMQHGTAKGVIKTISEGSFTTDDNGSPVQDPYFKVKVTITDVHLRNVPRDFRLIPGMTLAGDIMVGKRTILSYLVEGALRTGSEAMREP
jgi:hemolysin D